MSNFMQFKKAIQAQIHKMQPMNLYVIDADSQVMYEHYLSSFPAGTNPMFRERTEHDCSCCRQFIRDMGGVVAIKGNKLISIWDVKVDGFYQQVADAMAAFVKDKAIKDVFKHFQAKVGTDFNHETTEAGTPIKWEHFYAVLDRQHVMPGVDQPSYLGERRTDMQVLKRTVEEISLDAVETVMELIASNTLYRGEEHKHAVNSVRKYIAEYQTKPQGRAQEFWLWETAAREGGMTRVRNSVIGTLLVDLSEGKELEYAVNAFEEKVAPANYKRPKALVTPKMIKAAQKKVEELGIMDALPRRFARADDISVTNVLFADRETKKVMKNVFDTMMTAAEAKPQKYDNVETISVDRFVNDVVPTASKIELLFENEHMNNLVSLLAPEHPEARSILQWGNNFSWSYVGEVTDSIKERVKAAGGNVTGDLRVSLSWYNGDDLDIHIREPEGNHIYYGAKRNLSTGAELDVDMNAGHPSNRTDPVENVTWPDRKRMREGNYTVSVNNYCQRETRNPGFAIQVEFDGVTYDFETQQSPGNGRTVDVLRLNYTHDNGLVVVGAHASTASKEAWNINTNNFHTVKMLMNSPNHWDGEQTGNRHLFFMLEDCFNFEQARGFYNEFLRPDLIEHRKVFEMLGSQMKADPVISEDQLSGLGFSSTKKTQITVRVTGQTQRILKVQF